MNSGLQGLSHTLELTKYFLYGLHKPDINADNPLGLGGRLAGAYASLLYDLWIDRDPRTAPHDLKRVLGKRVARFAGYGQQDAGELVSYLLDLLHEDLNRVKKKPYVEMPEQEGRPDDEQAKLYWKAFLARNQSVVVDLMYGQLKSTVRCLECQNISIAFDPFLTLPLPIARASKFAAALVPYEVHRPCTTANDDSDEDEDPAYRGGPNVVRYKTTDHVVYPIVYKDHTTVGDLKQEVAEKAAQIGQRAILPENLLLCWCQYGEVRETYEDGMKVASIEEDDRGKTLLIEKRPDRFDGNNETKKCLELNFSRAKVGARGQLTQTLLQNAVPRFETFNMSDSVMDMKRTIYERIKYVFPAVRQAGADAEPQDDEWINDNIKMQIKDNTPTQAAKGGRGYGQTRKAECEFCGRRHTVRDDICDIRTADHKTGNSLAGAKGIRLQDLYEMIVNERDLVFEVLINDASQWDKAALKTNYAAAGGKGNSAYDSRSHSLDSCFQAFSAEELLTGNDQWYCPKCKEHRDIHKKLELFKIPKILIIQIKRF